MADTTPPTGDAREQRARMLVADLVEAIDVPPEGADAARPAPSPNRRRPLLTGVAAAITLMLVMAGVAMVPGRTSRTPAAGESTVTLPTELPVHRIWRAPQSWSPIGRAGMAYGFNTEDERWIFDASHFLVLGQDFERARHADQVYFMGDAELSPDGRFVVSSGEDAHLKIDDLSTRAGVDVDIEPFGGAEAFSARFAGWSADSRWVYVVLPQPDWSKYPGSLWRVGVDGSRREISVSTPVFTAAAAPDGSRLAVVRPDGVIDVISLDGAVLAGGVTGRATAEAASERDPRDAQTSEWPGFVEVLWSPDGSHLIVVEDQGAYGEEPKADTPGPLVTVVPVSSQTKAGEATSIRLDRFGCSPLAMLSETSLLCETHGVAPFRDALTTVDVRTGQRRGVAWLPHDAANPSVAADLARTWRFEMDEPWPLPPPPE